MPTESECDAPDTATIASLLREQALMRPEAPAILAPGRQPLSYAGLQAQAQRLGGHLRAIGVARSSRVAVVLPNGPEMAVAFLGVAACATCAPLNPASQAAEIRFHLQDTRAEALLLRRGEAGPARDMARELGLKLIDVDIDDAAPAGVLRLLDTPPDERPRADDMRRPPSGLQAGWPSPATKPHSGLCARAQPPEGDDAAHVPGAADDVALVLHTSGTTARPKLVPLSQANLVASARNIAAHLALTPADRCLNVMPLFHIHGLVGALLASMAGGASIVCAPGFDDLGFFDWVAGFDPSWTTAVPTMHQALLAQGAAYRQKAPLHQFRFVRSSSAALPAPTLRGLESLLQAPVVEAYGMTEAAHQMASNPIGAGLQTAGSVGVAAGAEIAILDPAGERLGNSRPGEIAVRGPGVIRGYENNAVANAQAFHNGWLRTGDLGHVDASGRLFISGRLKEIVNRGGEKISPREVDDALLNHPDVAQAATFGVPHPSLGEDLAAAVVRRAGSAPDESALRAFLFSRLSDFKVPSQIVFVHAIPLGATGKVQRHALHQALGASLARAFVAPATELERAVAQIFREVLECGPLGLHDNFFASGGDSLRGARAIARVNRQFGVSLPVIGLFRHPSVAELVAEIESTQATSAAHDARLTAEIEALSDAEVERLLAEAEQSAAARPPGVRS